MSIQLNPATGGQVVAADTISSEEYEFVKITLGDAGNDDGPVSVNNPIPANVNQEAVPGTYFATGQLVVSTVTPGDMTSPTPALKGVSLKADPTNGHVVFVGNSTMAVNGTDGYALYPNESIFIPVNDASDIWLVTAGGFTCIVYWMVV